MDEQMPYRKKSKRKPPAKADHKHHYEPCVLEYEGVRYDPAHGLVPTPAARISMYCPVCGKLGEVIPSEWYERFSSNLNEAGQRQIDPATRTIPTFRVEDGWFTKYVEL